MLLNNLPTIFRLFYPHFGTFFVNFCHCKTIPKCILQSLLKEKCCSTPIDFWDLCWRILDTKKGFQTVQSFCNLTFRPSQKIPSNDPKNHPLFFDHLFHAGVTISIKQLALASFTGWPNKFWSVKKLKKLNFRVYRISKIEISEGIKNQKMEF